MLDDNEGFRNILDGASASSEKRNQDKNNSLYVGISSDGKIIRNESGKHARH